MRQMGVGLPALTPDDNNMPASRAAVTTTDKWPKLLSAYVQNVNVYNSPIPGYVGTQYQYDGPDRS